ncbi:MULTISPECIES: DUF732 domain-containing protein [unclassified Streptomyces]|uniref:DUF732 domain-containing protein n=1 Tax=unclassified Streptomyces TaxID=2593676 RepID=UPI0004CBE8CD|nr:MULTISPECIES: DUF732 domain-containing protein [unclassified Streptomyces]KOV86076.1 hypothetical protein ADL02_19480 [Streptomyces sp. NRRL WC-3723]
MRRHATTVAVLLAAGLALAGCSNSSDTADAKPSPSKTVDKKETFLTAARAAGFKSWIEKPPSDDELADFPSEWCTALNEGHSVDWLFNEGGLYPYGTDWGTKKPEAYQLLVMGVKVYCPKHEGQVKEELRATGEY